MCCIYVSFLTTGALTFLKMFLTSRDSSPSYIETVTGERVISRELFLLLASY